MKRSRRLLAIAVALGAATFPFARAADLDFAAEEKASFELLRDLIRIDTQSGGESALLARVKGWLEREGFEGATIVEAAPGRGNLILRVKGAGKGAPLLLVAHVDTVKADKAEGWSADPLAADVKNDELVGRGVLDDKGQVALALTSLRLLRKEGVKLERDVVLMLNADEESGGVQGAGYVVKEEWEKLGPVGAAINEGGRCTVRDGKVAIVGIQTAEKIYNDVIVRVKGQSGHSSVPRPGNAIGRLARAIARIEAWKEPLRVIPDALGNFRAFATFEKDPAIRQALADLESKDEATWRRAAELLADTDPRYNALLRSTHVATLVKGGVKENQLPPDAEVNLNVRLLPDETLAGFLVALRHALRDEPDLQVVTHLAGDASPASPRDHRLYRAIEAAAKRHYPGAAVVPTLSTGATDSRYLRNKGVPSYGIGPFPLEEAHERSVHANDERLPVKSFGRGLAFYYEIVKAYATSVDEEPR